MGGWNSRTRFTGSNQLSWMLILYVNNSTQDWKNYIENTKRLVRMESNLIESNPAIMMGKPVIKGTRITVELIIENLAAGGDS